jgi:two-component system sensor histidine kinase PilS (NtrC family)
VRGSGDAPQQTVFALDTLPRLKWLVGLRLLLASALLGSAGVLDFHQRLPFHTAPLYGLLSLTFGLSLLYALALRSQRWLSVQLGGQLALDLVLVSLLVHYTGGVDSVFPFMYIFIIFAAANFLARRGSLLLGVGSGVLYAALVVAEWTRVIPPAEFAGGLAPLRSTGYAVYQVLIHLVAFLAVAILSSHLAYRLREVGQELERRGLDLRNLQTLHRVILANISSGLMTLDLAGHIVSFNHAAEQITGYAAQTMRDRPWEETPFAACTTMVGFFRDPAAALPQSAVEMTLPRADGGLVPIEATCSPLRDPDGRAAGLLVVFQDLTERKRVEGRLRQADRLAAVGHLAAHIAHEVRNPLAAISGAVEVLREDTQLAQANRQLLDIILGEAHRLKLVTGQFLDFAKPSSVVCRPCLVRPVLEETLVLLEQSGARHMGIDWEVAETPPGALVLADADQLRQVAWNLCLNAYQSMPEGGRLRIAVRPADPPPPNGSGPAVGAAADAAEWIELAFADSGRGMPAADLERIFDPFFTTRPDGTGLGLAIARKILEEMGGRIAAESREGHGSVFRIWLRRADGPLAPSPKEFL